MNKKEFIFTDCDLDGVGSYLVCKWCKKTPIPYKVTTCNNFREDFLTWLNNNKLTDYENVYILDIDVSEHADILDFPNITVIDHHSSIKSYSTYKKTKLIIDDKCSSATKLTLKALVPNKTEILKIFTPDQLKLINYIDDYDSYTLKYTESVQLNTILWSYTGNRVEKFVEEFENGFVSFNVYQKNMINIAERKIDHIIETADVFGNYVTIGTKQKLLSVVADTHINEVASKILHKYGGDVVFVVNLKSKSISLRKKKGNDVDLSVLAKKLCNGGGHKDSAGGIITEEFLKLTKLLTKQNEVN